ncbi:MAG: hypothetical protein WCH57_06220 [Verrucomicrobiota bacterium]
MDISQIKDIIAPCLGIVGVFVGYRLSAGKAQRDFRLSKLELLYMSVIKDHKHISFRAYRLLPIIEEDEVNGYTSDTESSQIKKGDIDEIEMIFNLYFPSLANSMKNYLNARGSLNAITIGWALNELKKLSCHDQKQCLALIGVFNNSLIELREAMFSEAKAIQTNSLFRLNWRKWAARAKKKDTDLAL